MLADYQVMRDQARACERFVSCVCASSALHPCAGEQTLSAVSTTRKWRARAETAGTSVNVGNLAIAVLQLGATPAASARRRYMALAG